MRNSVHSLTVLANFQAVTLQLNHCVVMLPILLFTILYMRKGGGGGGGGIGCDATDFNHKAHLKNFPQWLQHHIAGRKTADAKRDDSYSLI